MATATSTITVTAAELATRQVEPAVRPCPFCGSDDVRVDASGHSVYCGGCQALGPRKSDRVAAISVWNWALRHADTITCAECEDEIPVGQCACGGSGQ